MTGVFIKIWKSGHSDTQREDSHVTMETDMGVMGPQTKEYPGSRQPLEAGGGVEGSSPRAFFRGAPPCQHLDLRVLASRAVKRVRFCFLRHLVCGNCYGSPRKWIQSPWPVFGGKCLPRGWESHGKRVWSSLQEVSWFFVGKAEFPAFPTCSDAC